MAVFGIRATVLTLGPPSSFVDADSIHAEWIPDTGTGVSAMLKRILHIYKWLHKRRNMIGIAQFQTVDRFGLVTAYLMRHLGIPYSLRISGVYELEEGPFASTNLLDRFLLKRVLRSSTFLLALNDEIRQMMSKDPSLARKTVRIHNGVDTSIYLPLNGCLEANHFRVVFVGRLDPAKELTFLLSAWRRVQDAVPAARLRIIGEGPERERLERQSRDLRLGESVEFLGYRRDIPELLRGADLMVLSSRREGMPNVLLEGMASGLPVVCTDIPATRQCFREGKEGHFVPFGDEIALSGRIIELYRAPMKRKAMGEAARDHVQRFFSVEASTRHLLETYGMIDTS
jgi:glycosyltransferase involved in cell wall biosynthesis